MYQALLIMIGGGVGSLLRYWIFLGVHYLLGRDFPYGTLSVNIIGSFLVGLLSILLLHRYTAFGEHLRLLLIIGFLGGFTTFSSFSIETFNLFANGEMLKACLNIFLSMSLCLLGVTLGVITAKSII